jgi:hypothetical protein
MRMLIVMIGGAAIGIIAVLVFGRPFARQPVTKAQIEHEVGKRPQGNVQLVLCNEEVVGTQTRRSDSHTWTCDTYLGPSRADAQNGPSYAVTVSDDRIRSIREVPTH